jgi:hypothetical protein
MAKINKFDREYYVKHRERALANKWYAIGKFDTLIISISGGGIYVMFELMKYMRDDDVLKLVDITILKISGFLFTFAIICNFISQITGKKSNAEEATFASLEIKKIRNKAFDQNKKDWADFWGGFYSDITGFFNTTSTISMIAGVLLLAAFGYVTF